MHGDRLRQPPEVDEVKVMQLNLPLKKFSDTDRNYTSVRHSKKELKRSQVTTQIRRKT
jgi:hypothetical protein